MARKEDPLGYDTNDPDYLKQMARDALTGRNEAAVNAELAAVRKAFGTSPMPRSRWLRIKRWLSQRRWRFYYWRKDRGW